MNLNTINILDGREALRLLKSDPLLRRIPVGVLFTSKAEEGVFKFKELVQITKELGTYWFSTVALPKY